MKCPKCGSPMGEGQMYCGHCGTEIQIVPEFDTELDQNMRDALSETATRSEGQLRKKTAQEKAHRQQKRQTGKSCPIRLKGTGGVGLSLCLPLFCWQPPARASQRPFTGAARRIIFTGSPES